MPAGSEDPYAELLALAERELECAGAGDYAALPEIARRRATLIRSLPATPSSAAHRQTLVLATLTQQRVTIELQRVREMTLLALRRIMLGRRTAHGYADAVRQDAPTRVDARV